MLIKPDVRTLIDRFLNNDFKTRADVETVVLCGSYATERATSRSDIDLCFIGGFTAFKREVIIYDNYEFQLMIAPWSWYEDVITNYERQEGNGGTITVMLAQGICIFGENEKWNNLSSLVKKYFSLGPSPSSERTLRGIRLRVTGLFDNYCDQQPYSLNQSWLSFHLIECCIEAQFKIKNWWTVKPKYVLEELNHRDSVMADIVEECLVSKGSDKEALQKLCIYVLEPLGGFLRETMTIRDESKQ
jgi:hypothetical protein